MRRQGVTKSVCDRMLLLNRFFTSGPVTILANIYRPLPVVCHPAFSPKRPIHGGFRRHPSLPRLPWAARCPCPNQVFS